MADKDIMHEAIESLRKDMRARVGKKILSIDVSQPSEEEEEETEKPSTETAPQRRMGVSLL